MKPQKGGGEKPQSQRFKETARALECDEDERAFDEKLKQLVKAKPEKGEPVD